jgi:glycosidase
MSIRNIGLVFLALVVANFCGTAAAQDIGKDGNIFWQKQSIYQVITDRFYDGDPSNDNADHNYDPAGHRGNSVHGGDFKGIEDKLDYIKSLGATAIWISPVVLNVHGEFHGYAALDFYKVDPHWGTLADLRHFVRAAHARGLLVIDDIVVNHTGDLIYSTDPGWPKFKYPPDGYNMSFRHPGRQFAPPFNLSPANPAITNLFHNYGYIQDYNDKTQLVFGELSGLNDLKTETPYVREQMIKIYEYWIKAAGFDAFRIDTVKHVEMGFWQQWSPAIHAYAAALGKPNFFMFGEVPDDSDTFCGAYTGTEGGGPFKLDSILDYTLYFQINSIFARATGNTAILADHFDAVNADYVPASHDQLVTFLDNHDQPRFMSVPGATTNRLAVALAFLYTSRGIPSLYYGTEQGFNGRKDPWDREDMFAGQFEWGPSLGDNFNMTHPLYQYVAKLNNFRRLYPELQTGVQSNLWSDASGPGLFAYTRTLDGQQALVVLNTAESNQTLPPVQTMYPEKTKLINLLDQDDELIVGPDGQTLPEVMPGTSAKIFIPAPEMQPLDPVVTDISPAHDSKDILPDSPVIIHFSQPMDTASVEQAFTTIPRVKGAFSWSPDKDALTFTPAGKGYRQGMVSVRITDKARDAAGGKFYAGFESRFQCGEAATP